MRITKPQNFEERLASLHHWEHSDKVKFNLEEFARAGFFFENTFDIHDDPGRLRCAYCPAVIGNWQPEDDPWKEHILSVEHCPHVVRYKGEEFVERMYEEEEAIQDGMDYEDEDQDLELSGQFGLFGLLPNHLTRHEQKASNSLASRNGSFNEEMNNMFARLSSFRGCRHDDVKQRLYNELAESGFYFEGSDEHGLRARCFCCGRGLRDINDNDDIWRIHALMSDCEHVKKRKGLEFIQNIQDNDTTDRTFKDEEIAPDAHEQSRKRKETDSFESETIKLPSKRQRVQRRQHNDFEQTSAFKRRPDLYCHKGRMFKIQWRTRRRPYHVGRFTHINSESNASKVDADQGGGNNAEEIVFLCCRRKVCESDGGRGPCPGCLQDT